MEKIWSKGTIIDNPLPIAYFKFSFAPSCSIKKKVQRSAEDSSILVATYEGEHNHGHHSPAELSSSPNSSANHRSTPVSSAPTKSSAPTVTLELMQPARLGDDDSLKPA
ncbi:hypothetical protein REPUB_Repub18cG0020700 [Reevesia pubescens]